MISLTGPNRLGVAPLAVTGLFRPDRGMVGITVRLGRLRANPNPSLRGREAIGSSGFTA
jgi:hypothetical protein